MTKEMLFLHTCCGICGTAAEKLLKSLFNVQYFWYNPNIHPEEEHGRRMDVAKSVFNSIVCGNYEFDKWEAVCGKEGTPEEDRCRSCYKIRIEKTIAKAKESGANRFSTTLLVSPHQKHNMLKTLCEELQDTHKILFYYYDGRPVFYDNLGEFRKTGLYMQKYCGCRFSRKEMLSRKAGKLK